MRNGRRRYAAAAGICLALFVLGISGCKKNRLEAASGSVSFSWWGREERSAYTLHGIKQFEAAHPLIPVVCSYESWSDYEKRFEQDFYADATADLMQINFDWLQKYSPDGNGFYDINELADYVELYNYSLDDLAIGTVAGKLNAIPIAFNTAIPVYDQKSLVACGAKIPATWDELFALGRTLKKADRYVFTLSNRHLFFLSIAWFEQTYSKRVFSSDGKLNLSEAEITAMFDFVKRLSDEHVIYSPTKGYKLSSLHDGMVIGAVVWCNEVSQFIREADTLGAKGVLGNFITRAGATESGWYVKPSLLYAIKKNAKHPEAAAALLNYLLNDRDFALLQQNERGVPASNRALTALMERNLLESMQYEALLKIRFNSASINPMLPVMENTDVIKAFTDNAFAYSADSPSQNEAAARFVAAAAGGNQ